MDGVERYALDLANVLINRIINNYDPDARVNSKLGSSSPLNLLRISRVSFSVIQAETLEKEGTENDQQNNSIEEDVLAPDVIVENPDDSRAESDEDKDTLDSRSSLQNPASGEIPAEEEKDRVLSIGFLQDRTHSTELTHNTELSELNNAKRRISEEQKTLPDDEEDITESDKFFYSKINKDGELYKKCSNIFLGWAKRYVVIKNSKLLIAKDKKAYVAKKDIRYINFETQKCMITDVSNNKFSIEVVGAKNKLKLKAESKEAANDWVGRITKLMNYISVRDEEKIKYPPISDKKPWIMDSISQEEFLQTVQSGDVILFQTDCFMAKMQRKLTNSDYDHVGIIFRFNAQVFYFDATGYSGVSLTQWDEFMRNKWHRFYTKIAIRHLILEKPIQDMEDKIYEFIIDTTGAQYHLNMGKFFKRISAAPKGEAEKDARKNEGYFCSELVAAGYKRLGLLSQRKACSQYWPVNFSSKKKLNLLNGAKLSNEIQILFEK